MDTRTRPATHDDVADLLELSNAIDRAWWGQDETDADEVEQLLRLAGDLDERSLVVEADAAIAGCAVRFGSADISLLVAPELAPELRVQVEDELLRWLLAGGEVKVEAPAQDAELLAAYARHGLEPVESSFELERSPGQPLPDAELPDGVTLVAFDRDEHARPVHDLIYGFWADTPSHQHREFDQWRELFLGHGSFDPDQQVIAWRGERPVAAAICRTYPGGAGWIMQLGTAADERGRGLGRALLIEASRRLGARDDVETVGLSVYAENARALGLYRSVGFDITREWVTCKPAPSAGTGG